MSLANGASGSTLRTVPAVAVEDEDIQETSNYNSTYTSGVKNETRDENNDYHVNIVGGEVSDPGEFPYYGTFIVAPSFNSTTKCVVQECLTCCMLFLYDSQLTWMDAELH